MPEEPLRVECPCCHARLTVDPELAVVISHELPPRTGAAKDLGSAFDALRSKSAEREQKLKQAFHSESQKGKVLDRKFQEGLKKAKDSPDPPPRPFDFD